MALYEQVPYRLGQYLVGIYTGYIIQISKHQKLNKFIIFLGWTLSLGFLTTHIFHILRATVGAFLYDSVQRELWACSICWIIYACHILKSGGFVRRMLSQAFWQPLSKLCLSIYLTHYLYIYLTKFNQKDIQYVDTWWQIHIHIGDIIISFFLGGLFYLIVEAPASKLAKLFLARNDAQKTASSETEKLVNVKDNIK